MIAAPAISAAATVPTYIVGSRHFDGAALIVIGVAVWIGWGIVGTRNWKNVIKTTTRLGYLVGDVVLLAPGCVASGIGLLTDQKWGPPTLLLAVGAAAFDLTHTFIFTAEIGYPKINGKSPPPWAYVLVILVTLSLLAGIAWREIWFETGSHPPWFLWVLSVLAAIVMTVVVLVGVAAARRRERKRPRVNLTTTPPEP